MTAQVAPPEPQRRHDRKRIGQQNLLEIGITVRITVNLADEDIAADFHPLDDVHQRAFFAAAVFQIDKQREMRSHQTILSKYTSGERLRSRLKLLFALNTPTNLR